MSRRGLCVALLAIGGLVVAQSAVHLVAVLDAGRIDTFVDLDRSNGVPDLLSTAALAAAAVGAALSLRVTRRRRVGSALAVVLGALTLADLLHDGAHPRSPTGQLVIALVLVTGVLLGVAARSFSLRARAILAVAVALLAASFLTTGLDRYDQWFERERGDAVAEYQIVAKEGLELLGWSLVALALWDEALRRRALRAGATAPASRVPARPTRRAA